MNKTICNGNAQAMSVQSVTVPSSIAHPGAWRR